MRANNIYVIRCDRCGKECATNNKYNILFKTKKIKRIKFIQPIESSRTFVQTYEYNLCKDCVKELKHFMRKEGEIE